jgi:hypothetical protein
MDGKFQRLRGTWFNIELANGGVRPTTDKGLLDPTVPV